MEEEVRTTKDKIDEIYQMFSEKEKKEIKKLKLPRKSKVNRRKRKKGWMGILRIDENRNITGEKQKIDGFTVKTKDDIYHATDGNEIYFWEGKFPVIIQPSWRNNPINLETDIGKKNETYGQKYIMGRMLADIIKVKSKSGSTILWILIIAAIAYGAYYLITKGV